MAAANSKNQKIQLLRAIAICSVVVIHSYPHNLFGVFVRSFVNFAVSLFLFLSGYLTKLEYDDWKQFWLRRIKRVVIPYVVWSILWVLVNRNFNGFFIKLLTGRTLYPYYYVFVYVQFVLFSPLIACLAKQKYRWVGWLIQPSALFILNYLGFSKHVPFSVLFSWFTPFYLGLLLGNHIIKWEYDYKKTGVIWLISFIFSIAEGLLWYKAGNYEMATTQGELSNCLYTVPCLLLAYKYITDDAIKVNNTTGNRIMITLGDYSFGIFLTHAFVLKLLGRLPFYHHIFFPLNSVLAIAITALCVYLGRLLLKEKYGKILGLF